MQTRWGILEKTIKTGRIMKSDKTMTRNENKVAHGTPLYRAVKRALDVIFSVILFIVFLPVFVVFSIIIFLTDFHNPIYCQKRVGRHGKMFSLIKFRTMRHDANDLEKYLNEEQLRLYNAEYKLEDDPRVTGVGRFLRRFSIDELPQFLNVIAGHMSLIGPRPLTMEETYFYGDRRDDLLSVRPGITGLWQVSGRNDLTYESGERQKCEITYVENFGLKMDLKIFFKTFSEIFSGRGK